MDYMEFEQYMQNVVEHLNKTKKPGLYDFSDFVSILSKKVEYEKDYILDTPIEVEWEITSRCNFKCEYCYHFSIDENIHRKDLSSKQAYEIINQLVQCNVLVVRLEGGEPFLRPDIIDIIKEIKRNRIGLYILTNASLITQDNAESLAEILNPITDHVQVSFDSLQENIFNEITSTKLRNSVIDGLSNLNKTKVIPIIISMVVTEKNINEIVPIYEFISQFQSVIKFNVSPALSIGNYQGFRLSKELLLPQYKRLFSIYEEKGGPIIDPMLGHAFHLDFYKKYIIEHQNEFTKYDNRYPKAGRSMLTIASDGTIYGEHNMTYSEMCMGNILEGSLLDIWANRKWNIIRNGRDEQSECRKCDMNIYCSQRSIGIAYSKYRTIQAKDPNCLYVSNGQIAD